MGNLGDETVHTRSVLKPYGVWGVISPFNFPFALSGGPAGGALVAGNTVVYKPSSDAPLSGACLLQAMRDAGVPDGVFNMVMGPGETVGDEIQTNPGVDGDHVHRLVRGRLRALQELRQDAIRSRSSSRWAARTRRSCHATPTSTRRPRGSCARRSASPGRSARRTAGSTSSGRSTTSSSSGSSRRPRRSRSAIRPTAGTGSVRSSTRKAVDRYEQAVSDARRDGRLAIGGERVTERRARHGLLRRPDGRVRPADRPPPVPRRAVRAVHRRRRRSTRSTRRFGLSNDTNLGLTAGFYSEDQAEIDTLPRPDRGRRRLRQPTRRRDDRGVAGHPAVRWLEGIAPRRARPAAASTTSSSSCASRARRSSTDGTGYQTSPGRQSQLIGESRSRGGDMTVSRTRMKPSSSGVRRAPSGVRTNAGPRHVRQPSRS